MTDRDLDYIKLTGPGVDALEARKEHSARGPEITEGELAVSLQQRKRPPISRREEIIQMAVMCALGCTTIDYKSASSINDAANQIARFVERELQCAEAVDDVVSSLSAGQGPKAMNHDRWQYRGEPLLKGD